MVNRRISMKMIVQFARDKPSTQFILLTPQDTRQVIQHLSFTCLSPPLLSLLYLSLLHPSLPSTHLSPLLLSLFHPFFLYPSLLPVSPQPFSLSSTSLLSPSLSSTCLFSSARLSPLLVSLFYSCLSSTRVSPLLVSLLYLCLSSSLPVPLTTSNAIFHSFVTHRSLTIFIWCCSLTDIFIGWDTMWLIFIVLLLSCTCYCSWYFLANLKCVTICTSIACPHQSEPGSAVTRMTNNQNYYWHYSQQIAGIKSSILLTKVQIRSLCFLRCMPIHEQFLSPKLCLSQVTYFSRIM